MKEIEKLYDLYSKDVYRFIYSLSFDEEIAKDIMQITFLECIKSIKNFKGKCSEKTWLLAIAKNQYYTYLKKHPKTQSKHLPGSGDVPAPSRAFPAKFHPPG